ncbi:MAG: DNA primase [Alphaproteobacteria bacterium]|nr:MAG: DNA primase [Alphaproteobacteria bacterium]
MRFSPSFLDELRSRISLVDLIGRKVALKRAGREWKGLCPFHKEKTPSFHVVEDKGFYHCFGCGAHGDAIRWLEETENLSFGEAVRDLAARAGLPLPAARSAAEDKARQDRIARLFALLEQAALHFTRALAGARGTRARAYLEERAVTRETMADFRLGYAPDGQEADRLLEELRQAGYRDEELVAAGLAVLREGEPGRLIPRFRNRLIFPIADSRERIIGFGGRTLGDHPAKYLNSPDGPLFHKGRVLYHYAPARRAARDGNLFVVEGYMDVIALAQAGFEAAVAPLGTAVTERQLTLMWRVANEPIFCFDGDTAGRAAADRVIARALPLLGAGRSLRFVLLPEGEDPDSFLRHQGAQAFAALVERAVPLVDMLWEIEIGGADLSTPERRRQAEENLMRRVASIPDRRLAQLYRDSYWRRLRPATAAGARSRIGRRSSRYRGRPSPALLASRAAAAGEERRRLGARLLVIALELPALTEAEAEEIATLDLGDERLDKLRDAMLEALHGQPGLDRAGLDAHLKDRGFGPLLETIRREAGVGIGWKAGESQREERAHRSWQEIKLRVRDLVLESEEAALTRKLAQQDADVRAWERLRAIKAERREIARSLKAVMDREWLGEE